MRTGLVALALSVLSALGCGKSGSSGSSGSVTDAGMQGDAGTGPCDPMQGSYFVATTGSDAAAGTRDAPFLTIQHALDVAEAGAVVVVGGGVYHELVEFPRSGTTGAPIVLRGACGTRPVIDGTGLGGGIGEAALVRIVDRAFVTVQGFELRGLTGSGGNFPAGVWVRGGSHDVRIAHNVVHGIAAQNGGNGSGAHGIAVYGTTTTPVERVTIEGNELYGLLLGWSEAVVVNGNVRDFAVTANLVHDVDNIAFDFIGFEADVCPSCTQDDVTNVADVNRVRSGTVVGNVAHHVTSNGNPAYGSERSAGCFYVDGGADLVIERNVAHHCDLGVELASEHYGKSTRGVVLRNNFLYQNDVTGLATGGYSSGTGAGGGSTTGCVIVGNTISDSSRNGWANAGIFLQSRNVGNVFANNIVVASAGSDCVAVGGSMNSGNVFDRSVYSGGAVSGVSGGANSITADPRLVDPANGDLHLGPGSPAIDAGDASLGDPGAVDIDGQPRQVGALDIGADER